MKWFTEMLVQLHAFHTSELHKMTTNTLSKYINYNNLCFPLNSYIPSLCSYFRPTYSFLDISTEPPRPSALSGLIS